MTGGTIQLSTEMRGRLKAAESAMLKPELQRITTEFWNSCDAIAKDYWTFGARRIAVKGNRCRRWARDGLAGEISNVNIGQRSEENERDGENASVRESGAVSEAIAHIAKR